MPRRDSTAYLIGQGRIEDSQTALALANSSLSTTMIVISGLGHLRKLNFPIALSRSRSSSGRLRVQIQIPTRALSFGCEQVLIRTLTSVDLLSLERPTPHLPCASAAR